MNPSQRRAAELRKHVRAELRTLDHGLFYLTAWDLTHDLVREEARRDAFLVQSHATVIKEQMRRHYVARYVPQRTPVFDWQPRPITTKREVTSATRRVAVTRKRIRAREIEGVF